MKNIYFVCRKTYHCQRTLNQLWLRWHFVIKSVWFQHSKFSKVAKMIYNSISDVCPVVFAPSLDIHSLHYNHFPHKLDKTTLHLSLWLYGWTCFDFPCTCAVVQMASEMAGKFKMPLLFFFIVIYKFNINLFI